MGEGARGLGVTPSNTAEGKPPPRAMAETLGSEVAMVRAELDSLLAELDRRRHAALDVRLQLRRHALGATLTSLAFVGTAAESVWLGGWRRRRHDRLIARAGRFRQAISRMIERPERVGAEPTMAGKIATATVSAGVAALIKKALARGVERLLERRDITAKRSTAPREGPAASSEGGVTASRDARGQARRSYARRPPDERLTRGPRQ
jgi:hypothetical protein